MFIGASNLTRGISAAIELVRQVAGGPIEFHVAMGFARGGGADERPAFAAALVDGARRWK